MCGRYTLRTNLSLAIKQFGLPYDGPDLPRYNVAPTQSVPAVRVKRTWTTFTIFLLRKPATEHLSEWEAR
jgi:putative SOS response-associated peptidase YedK